MSRPGTIKHAMSLADGSRIHLDAVVIRKIRARQSPDYIVVGEMFSQQDKICVITQPSPNLRVGQTVDIDGYLSKTENQTTIVSAQVLGYTDRNGAILYHGPLIKGLLEPTHWNWMLDLTIASSAYSSSNTESDPIDPPGDVDPSTNIQVVSCSTVTDAKTQPVGTVVEINSKPINSATSGSFVLGEDDNSDNLTVIYTGTVSTDDRAAVVYGTIDTTDGNDKILDLDSGPNYNVQESYQGSILTATQGTIAWAKTLPDSSTSITLTGKVITHSWTNYFYIEDDDRSCGIRVQRNNHGRYKGNKVNITGTLATNLNGERYINATSVVLNGSGTITPLGMPNK